MIKETTTLTCRFRDSLGKSRSMTINSPKEDLTVEEISEFMEVAIESNVVTPNQLDRDVQLETVHNAAIVRRVTETIEF